MIGNNFYKNTNFSNVGVGSIESFFIQNYLSSSRGKYFFEAGAVNGFHMSQTATLEKKYGWTGLLIEGHSELFSDLENSERKAICRNYILGNGEEKIFEEKSSGYIGHSQLRDSIINKDCHPCFTTTIEECLTDSFAPQVIDFMVIDVEDSWLEVLSGIDFEKREIDFLAIEMKGCEEHRVDSIQMLKSQGLELIKVQNGEDFLFSQT
tara:strand:+ start:109 stop:732 length:624 start_codon:yes stop_codon:yes gene_type:complete